MSKRRLYARYCYENGHEATVNNFGKYNYTERNDEQWIEDDDVVMDVLSWTKFRHQWKLKHKYLRIRKPAEDICNQCFHKNKMVLRLAAYLVEMNYFKSVNFIFYVVGHTKNPADRFFNLAKAEIRQKNVYTMQQFIEYMSHNEFVTAIEVKANDFYDYNKLLETLYKSLDTPQVKKWQIFSVEKEEGKPLSMVFKTSNREHATTLVFSITLEATTNRHELLTAELTQLVPPGRRPIKQMELYTKYRKFIPEIYQDACCPKPTDEILDKYKVEKSEKVKLRKEKKDEVMNILLESAVQRAAGIAMAQTPIITVELAENDSGSSNKKRKGKNNKLVHEA